MTFPPDDEYGESLRRALRAEADSVVPSPDGLEIIRSRIDQRGMRRLRNMLWWRVGAATAGALAVAGAIVLVVPGLRDEVGQRTGFFEVDGEREQGGDTSTVTRPPDPPAPSRPGVIVLPVSPSPSRGRPTPAAAQKTGPAPRPSPSPSDPCALPAPSPGVVEPESVLPATCGPTAVTQPPAVTRPPKPRRTFTAGPTVAPPVKTSTPTAAPPETPTETATPDSAGTPTP